jgi:L-fuculose-phosphate aldolase
VGYHAPARDVHLSEQALREEFVRIGQLMHSRNYVTATDGNISARLDDDRFLVTPSGQSKGFMRPQDMIVIDWDVRPLNGNPDLRPSSEILLHLEAYRQRPTFAASTHPPTAIALTIAGISLAHCRWASDRTLIVTTDYATRA